VPKPFSFEPTLTAELQGEQFQRLGLSRYLSNRIGTPSRNVEKKAPGSLENTTYPKRTNTVGKLCLSSASLIWRNAYDPRESLPMPGMRAAPAGADFRSVRLGEAEG